MPITVRIIGLALLLVLVVLVPTLALADQAFDLAVHYSATCDHCQMVREKVLAPLSLAYGDRLSVTLVDVSRPEGLNQLETMENRLGKLNNPLPVIHVGNEIIASEDLFELEAALTELLRERLGEPGQSGLTPITAVATATVPATIVATTRSSQQAVIHLAYIEKEGCDKCARGAVMLQVLQEEYPMMVASIFNDVRDADLIEAMGEHLGLPESQRLIAPSIYVGSHALVGAEVTSRKVRALLDKYSVLGAAAFWEGLDTEAGENSILTRFRAMGPLTVILAALIDGINPCAFATIIFFVSWLAVSQRRRGAMLAVGLAFTAGVFVAYLLVGLGAMSLLRLASTLHIVGMILYGLMAVGCFVLAGVSVHDYVLARRGKLKEMRLNLPESMRERIKGRIRSARGAFVGGVFVSGLFVSLLELACTGQVYLPTISFVVGIPGMRTYAIAYLVLYNLIFVVPLLVVLFLATYGVSAVRFQDWFVQNAARAKLIMALLFLLLGAWLVSQVLSM